MPLMIMVMLILSGCLCNRELYNLELSSLGIGSTLTKGQDFKLAYPNNQLFLLNTEYCFQHQPHAYFSNYPKSSYLDYYISCPPCSYIKNSYLKPYFCKFKLISPKAKNLALNKHNLSGVAIHQGSNLDTPKTSWILSPPSNSGISLQGYLRAILAKISSLIIKMLSLACQAIPSYLQSLIDVARN